MKKLILSLCLLAGMAFAQQNSTTQTIPVTLPSVPVGDCRVQFYTLAYVPSTQVLYGCNTTTGAWTTQSSLSGLTITSSTGTLTIPNGVTLTGPAVSGTTATLGGTETLTNKTLTSPVMTAPTLGVATATSLNGLTVTTSTGTFTLTNGKTFAVGAGLTLTGTDSTTMTFPTTSATIARTDAANTFTGVQTMTSAALTTPTLTTPTVTNPVISGPAPVACGATCAPTTGQLILLNQSAGSAVTLPTSAGTGNVIRMRVSVITTSAQEKVLLTTTSDVIVGTATGENSGTAKVFVGNAATYHSIQMPFAGSQPSGGFVGDTITCTDIAAGTWACDVTYQAGTTPTTPYSTSTT